MLGGVPVSCTIRSSIVGFDGGILRLVLPVISSTCRGGLALMRAMLLIDVLFINMKPKYFS